MSNPESTGATPTCAIDGCDRPVRAGRLTRYCSPEHTREGKANQRRMYKLRLRARRLPRQEPVQPAFALPNKPLVLRPPHPAPLQYYDYVFQDDLNAINDHGSPGRLIAP